MSQIDFSRAILETDTPPDTLAIRLRAKRDLFTIVFLSIWLTGWAAGWLGVPVFVLLGGMPAFAAVFAMIWWLFWTWGGWKAVQVFLWHLGGMERLVIAPDTITVTRGIPFRRRTLTCDASAVTDLRATRPDTDALRKLQKSPSFDAPRDKGSIKFDYGGHTIGFGLGLSAEETRELAELIHRRFPRLNRPARPLRPSAPATPA